MPSAGSLHARWRKLSIASKLRLAFAVLVGLVVAVAAGNFGALMLVRAQTERTIATSVEIQRLVLQMDAKLQHARLQERDFFLRWPELGFERAESEYVSANKALIAEVVALSDQLRRAISKGEVSAALHDRRVDVNFYLTAANRYSGTFEDAVGLVAKLAAEGSGAQDRLNALADNLYRQLYRADDTQAIIQFRLMQAHEKDYMVTRQRPYMQSAFNVANQLSRIAWASPNFTPEQKSEVASLLKQRQTVAEEIIALDREIHSLFREFDLQDQAIDPISRSLVTLAAAEVERARQRAASTAFWSGTASAAALLGAIVLAILIALFLNRAFTRNVVLLSEAVAAIQAGDLSTRVRIDSGDEFGRLVDGFNAMAARIGGLVEELSGQVAIAEARLFHAIESIPQGFCIYDVGDSLVLSNARFGQLMLPGHEELAKPGRTFAEIAQEAAALGLIRDAQERPGIWISERLAQHRNPSGSTFERYADGRWIEIEEYRTNDGDTVSIYTDVTERKRAELNLVEAKRRAEEATRLATERNQMLEVLSNQLAKYLSPQVYSSIFSGKSEVRVASARKKLTIFFSDIANFTETADQLESEQLTQVLNRYLTEMATIALAHGATIDKFIGDAILAFFGDPESRGEKEDAAACVQMAIAMQRRMAELQTEWSSFGWDKPFQVRMGINTGYCTVGNFGSDDRMDYTIIGNQVNLASRLQSSAPLGGILLGPETYALVRDTVRAKESEPITAKGFARPIRCFAVIARHEIADETNMLHHSQPGFEMQIDILSLSTEGRAAAIAAVEEALHRLQHSCARAVDQ